MTLKLDLISSGVNMKKFIGELILFVVMGISIIGSKRSFFDLPSFLFVFGILLGSLIASFGIDGLFKSFLSNKLRVIKTAKTSLFVSAILGPCISLIHLLSNAQDKAIIGPALAVACLTVLYSAIFYLGFVIYEMKYVTYVTSKNKS